MRQKLSILSLFLALWLTSNSQATQDSARLKVTKTRTADNKTYYWLKDVDTKENYFTVCECYQKHQKGEIVLIARKDIEIIPGKVTYRKTNY